MYVSSSSYIRKIDELGRVVIPKEVRNKLKIQDNENILISYDNNKINITKYSYLNNYNQFICEICNQIDELYRIKCIVYDREKIIFSNYTSKTNYSYKEDIIKDSTVIGSIKMYSDYEMDLSRISKFASRIIAIYLSI